MQIYKKLFNEKNLNVKKALKFRTNRKLLRPRCL